MDNMYGDVQLGVPHDVISYEQAILFAASHHLNHFAETRASLGVLLCCSLMTSSSVVVTSKVLLFTT